MHSGYGRIIVLAKLVLLYFCMQSPAWAQPVQWTPELMQPAAKARDPSEPFRIRLAKIPAKTLQLLTLELDEIDVTSMVAMEGDVAVFTPPQPLAYGEHQLRLVENSPDGSINERGQWSFELRKSALFRDAQANGSLTLRENYRAADHGLADPAPARSQADAAGQFAGSVENENWRANAMLSFIANQQSQMMPRQKGHLDLGQFLAAADSGMYGFKLGDHAIGPDSMVLQSFGRRGISVSATAPGDRASVTGFSMHATPLSGAANVLGVADDGNRVDGVVAALQPIADDAGALALLGTYVSGGSENQTGAGGFGGSDAGRGSAGSIVADSSLLQQRLRLRGEFARSSYDFDGRVGDLAAMGGHAYSGLVNFVPWHDRMIFDQAFLLNVGLEKKLISSYFHSPSNPGAISDRDMVRIFTGVNWYGLDFQANAGKETDNVDNSPLIPVTASRQRSAAISYSPMMNYTPQADGQLPEPPWYGQPSLSASFMSLNREVVQLGGSAVSQPAHSTYNSTVGANFQYALWSWGIMQSWVRDRGYNLDMTPLTRSASTQLQGNFLFFEKLTVGMNAFNENVDNVDAGIKTNGIGGGLNLAYPFTDTVSSMLSYSTRHDWLTDGSNDSVTSDTTASVNWVVDTPHGAKPGITLGMDGSYHNVSNKSGMSTQPLGSMYQVFLRVSLAWSPSY
ncbi:MAG: hypothetical protein KKH12_06410 [Gammaproteobacteria bacterium]|nr:hypothetical protein [Gammaproteobacteria bacterium]MBU1481293.1 hypothetical protein [Gammaproteobacteria bacterium]